MERSLPLASLERMTDVVCFSHIRWNLNYQRPQHLLSRFANNNRVFYIEEPVVGAYGKGFLDVTVKDKNLWIVVPSIPKGLTKKEIISLQNELLEVFFQVCNLQHYIFWYYTPMALEFSRNFNPQLIIYDCISEVSSIKGVSSRIKLLEDELFKKADMVFTAGHSLYEAKRLRHPEVYPFPGSIDVEFFAQSRKLLTQPEDQKKIPFPRIGFFGVMDERMDFNLLKDLAEAKPEWQFVMIGPALQTGIPVLPNIHFLGAKSYTELPGYISGWDIALLPFAINKFTRYSNPTKIPEYLAAGKPVVSTPVPDVVKPYGEMGLLRIATTTAAFIKAIEDSLKSNANKTEWLSQVDVFLACSSWNRTWTTMSELITKKLSKKPEFLFGPKNKRKVNLYKRQNMPGDNYPGKSYSMI